MLILRIENISKTFMEIGFTSQYVLFCDFTIANTAGNFTQILLSPMETRKVCLNSFDTSHLLTR